MFSFEKMIAWQKAADLSDQIFVIADELPPKWQSSFGDQLRRACLSVTNNLAEGSGKRTPASQRNFYDIAHGSLYEVMSMLTLLKRRKIVSIETHQICHTAGDEIAAIIYGLMQACEARKTLREDGVPYDA